MSAGGKGTLGSWCRLGDDGSLSLTMQDLRTASQLKSISEKITTAKGRGLLIADPRLRAPRYDSGWRQRTSPQIDDPEPGQGAKSRMTTATLALSVQECGFTSRSPDVSDCGLGTMGALVEERQVSPRTSGGQCGVRRRSLKDISMEMDACARIGSWTVLVAVVRGSLVLIGGDPGVGKSTSCCRRPSAGAGRRGALRHGEESRPGECVRPARYPTTAPLWRRTICRGAGAPRRREAARSSSTRSRRCPAELESAPAALPRCASAGRADDPGKGSASSSSSSRHEGRRSPAAGARALVDTVSISRGAPSRVPRAESGQDRFGSTNEIASSKWPRAAWSR